MIASFLLIALVTAGGFALTYRLSKDEPLIWRLAAGCIAGSAIFGTAGLLFGGLMGFGVPAAGLSFVAVLLLLLIFRDKAARQTLRSEWLRGKSRATAPGKGRALGFFYYAFFAAMLLFFFDRAMIETDSGIFTGGSQNLGDLPFHLGAIFAFTEGGVFPPENPNFAGVKFTYPFIADLITAMFVKLGIGVREAMLAQNLAWALSLLVLLERFVFRLVNDRLAARLAPPLLFFSGGLGFIYFFSDFFAQSRGFTDFLWNLPTDYTIGERFRWGNSLTTLFMTQRSLLLGMPLTILVLGLLWSIFSENTGQRDEETTTEKSGISFTTVSFSPALFIYGLLAGTLVLIHLHSLAVLFVACVLLMAMRPEKVRLLQYVAFGICVSAVAVPMLLWSMSGSATNASEFIGWHFGWDKREDNFLWFWLKNTGLVIPLVAVGLYLMFEVVRPPANAVAEPELKPSAKKKKKAKEKPTAAGPTPTNARSLLMFYVPFAAIFMICNAAKLAPWEWDNIKLLIYWYLVSIPFIAYAVSFAWRQAGAWKGVAAAAFALLIFSGSLDVWRTLSGAVNYEIFSADAVEAAEKIKDATEKDSLFLNAPTYNSTVVLTGRRSLMRYSGHLQSHGIDYRQREADVKTMYAGGPQAEKLLREYGIEYVLISQEERNTLQANEEFFSRFPVVVETGQNKVVKVRNEK
ncbi:MAG TPA: hypothetical protein PKD24_00215 [Pyrinomonadaceae bacterium]|nr:hypothetical protein [Pyrinomonadaceae bacterium]HMP64422.1 hypothetical protein [Pyrinomonadaceae bacterium]